MKNRVVHLDKIQRHPLNRKFETSGPTWEQFIASIRQHGVMTQPILRYLGDGIYEILAGERRITGARQCELDRLDCTIKEMTDREALEFLLLENLQREDPDPVEEGKMMKALGVDGMSPAEIAARINRSVEWVKTRQGLLDLPIEAQDAVRRPKEDEGHLHIRTVELLLALDAEVREEAVQLVLHSEWKLGTLNPREAENVIRQTIMEPRREKEEWEKGTKDRVKAWRKRLAEHLTKGEKTELIVQAAVWNPDGPKLTRAAEDFLKDDPLVNAEVVELRHRWLHLALRNGIPVWIVPAENDERSVAVVDEKLLRMSEKAREENGVEAWLHSKVKPGAATNPEILPPRREGGEEESRDKNQEEEVGSTFGDARVGAALAALDGEPDPNWKDEENVEVVIEQSFERSMYLDVTPVMKIKAWAERAAAARNTAEGWDLAYPDGTPAWLVRIQLDPEDVTAMCDWILSLKK